MKTYLKFLIKATRRFSFKSSDLTGSDKGNKKDKAFRFDKDGL